jgi:hypothetical protein
LQKKVTADGKIFEGKKKTTTFLIHPTSRRRIAWDMAISCLCFYIAIAWPFVVAFENLHSRDTVDSLQVLDRFIDYVFGVDVLLNFRTGFFSGEGELIMEWKRIAFHYLRTWCLLDVASSFPFEDVSQGKMMNFTAVKLLKLVKLMKLMKLMKPRNVDFAEVSDFVEDFLQSKVMQILFRRGGVFLKMILLCHWMACGMKFIDEGFLETYQDIKGGLWREYLAALYWAMTTMTTVGYGDIIPSSDAERAYCLVAMVVGGAFYGYIVGSITSIVANNDLNASAYYDRMDLIHAWLTHHNQRIPRRLKRNLRSYFKSYLTERSAVSESDIWHDLSPELQKDVGEYIVHEDVRFNPLFDGLNMGTVVRLQSILQTVTILSGRTITAKDEAGTAMYFIVAGSVRLDEETDEENSKRILLPGQSFGEEVLLGLIDNYTYSVTTMEKSKFQMITEEEFLTLFQAMPNVLERMRANAIDMNPKWKKSSSEAYDAFRHQGS